MSIHAHLKLGNAYIPRHIAISLWKKMLIGNLTIKLLSYIHIKTTPQK